LGIRALWATETGFLMAAHKDLAGIDLHEPKGIEDATSGQYYAADGTGSGTWTSLPGGIVLPFGMVVDYAGTSAPSLWLLCYGQAISRTTYSDLFSAISTTYGTGDGSTTFNLPDCRGRVTAGQDDMGGVSADRLTGLANGVNGDTLGASGGLESFTLATANLPSHSHTSGSLTGETSTDGSHTHDMNNATNVMRTPDNNDATSGSGENRYTSSTVSMDSAGSHNHDVTVTGSTATAGSGTAMPHIQPTIVLNKIIYAGV
jgi:microcystin-dependent protein